MPWRVLQPADRRAGRQGMATVHHCTSPSAPGVPGRGEDGLPSAEVAEELRQAKRLLLI